MPKYRITTDQGTFEIATDLPTTNDELLGMPEVQQRILGGKGAAPTPAEPSPAPTEPGTDWTRSIAQGLGGTLGAGVGLGTPLGPAGPLVGAGLGAGMAGQGVDLLRSLGGKTRGEPGTPARPLRDVPGQMLEDFNTGMVGEAQGQGLIAAGGKVARGLGLAGRKTGQAVKQAADRLGIPMSAADITGSPLASRVENFGNYFAIGAGKVQRFRGKQMTEAGRATGEVLEHATQQHANALTAGLAARDGVKGAVAEFRRQSDQLFRQIEVLAGPEPVVPTTRLREAAEALLGQAREAPMAAPSGAQKLAGVGESVPVPGGQASPYADYAELLAATRQDFIPFQTARRIESQLGEMAFRGRSGPIGNMRQGQAGKLYKAVRGDLDEYLTTPSAEAAGVKPALEEAKQTYATGKELFQRSVNKLVLSEGRGMGVRAADVVDRVFQAGNIEDTLDFKLAVTDDVYEKSVSAWLGKLREKATKVGPTGEPVFSPRTFVTELAKYEKNGHLDVILEPAAAAEVRELAGVLGHLGTAERIAGNPAGTGQAVLSSGQLLALLRMIPSLLASGGAAGAGAMLGGVPGAMAGALGPAAVARSALSGPGIRLLSEGFQGTAARPTARMLSQLMAQREIERLERQGGKRP